MTWWSSCNAPTDLARTSVLSWVIEAHKKTFVLFKASHSAFGFFVHFGSCMLATLPPKSFTASHAPSSDVIIQLMWISLNFYSIISTQSCAVFLQKLLAHTQRLYENSSGCCDEDRAARLAPGNLAIHAFIQLLIESNSQASCILLLIL